MGPSLEKAVYAISTRMQLMRALQEEDSVDISEREMMILRTLEERGKMAVSEIANCIPNASDSTISMTVTRLWREKGLVSKNISPQNQRMTFVELTKSGTKLVEKIRGQKAERFDTLFRAIEMSDSEREIFLSVLARAVKYFDEHMADKYKETEVKES